MTISLNHFKDIARQNLEGNVTLSSGGELINKGTLSQRTATFFKDVASVLSKTRSDGKENTDLQRRAIDSFSNALKQEYGERIAGKALKEYGPLNRLTGQKILDVEARTKQAIEEQKKIDAAKTVEGVSSKALSGLLDKHRVTLEIEGDAPQGPQSYGRVHPILRGNLSNALMMTVSNAKGELAGKSASDAQIYHAMLNALPDVAAQKGIKADHVAAVRLLISSHLESIADAIRVKARE